MFFSKLPPINHRLVFYDLSVLLAQLVGWVSDLNSQCLFVCLVSLMMSQSKTQCWNGFRELIEFCLAKHQVWTFQKGRLHFCVDFCFISVNSLSTQLNAHSTHCSFIFASSSLFFRLGFCIILSHFIQFYYDNPQVVFYTNLNGTWIEHKNSLFSNSHDENIRVLCKSIVEIFMFWNLSSPYFLHI